MKKEKNFLKELKKTPRGKAILKLSRWFIFFLALFIFCLISSSIASKPQNTKKDNESTKEIDTSYLMMLEDKLLRGDYEYHIEIKTTQTIFFTGTKKGNINTGYKGTTNGMINYLIDSTGTYRIDNNEKEIYEDLYQDIKEEYLKIENLVSLLKTLNFVKKDNLTYESMNNDASFLITIKDSNRNDDNMITELFITDGDATYHFKYSSLRSLS